MTELDIQRIQEHVSFLTGRAICDIKIHPYYKVNRYSVTAGINQYLELAPNREIFYGRLQIFGTESSQHSAIVNNSLVYPVNNTQLEFFTKAITRTEGVYNIWEVDTNVLTDWISIKAETSGNNVTISLEGYLIKY